MADAAGTGAATAGAGSGAGGTAGAGAAAAAGAPAPWYGDKIDETTRGFWQNKGIDPADPIAVAVKLTDFYRQAEQRIGAPPEELIRIPKPNASEADIRAYWGRIGVPAEAKDYDLSALKFSDGKELGTAFADSLRTALLAGRVPKDRAAELVKPLLKQMEDVDAAKLAERTAVVRAEREALDKNWGTNKAFNEQIAKRALEDLGKASGLTAEQTSKAWDALSLTGGIGASYAMEMLRNIGARMSETPGLIGGQPGPTGDKVMSAAQAKARIDELKMDRSFYKRMVTDKEAAAKREWEDLHRIAFRAA